MFTIFTYFGLLFAVLALAIILFFALSRIQLI
uniref:Cytochrome b6-f complex subunit 6 n=1 Tax=Cylindrocystis brebissonii TaxID=102167 RepID=A0A191T631_9VIRI|nr:subunit VI of cytochrome b6/f complex [Cylindrocystis brebissonii]ANI25853.1 subunit VI of cytochrome b6/f complex [Cylindrocystis brebissonii]